MFRNAADGAYDERRARIERGKNLLRLGIDFLDDALVGLGNDDLMLLGSPTGAGKTACCCTIALANIADGKRVHFFALEASELEIESRLKFQLISDQYHADNAALKLPRGLTFDEWYLGRLDTYLDKYERVAADFFAKAYKGLNVFYKQGQFDVSDLVDQVVRCASETDLILIDHAHYFDFAEENENRALKALASTCRMLALENRKPIVLVSHLRKRDRANQDIAPGIDEFHGSSDLTKIASRVVTMAPGRPTASGGFETFFRISKNRLNQSALAYVARAIYQPTKGSYEAGYRLGWATQQRGKDFEDIEPGSRPRWAVRAIGDGGNPYPVSPRGAPVRVPVTRGPSHS